MSDAVYIRNLNFCYGNQQVLQNFNARVPFAQIYALLGPSGGGKTTLLKLILGRLKPQEGVISVLGLPPGEANSNISFMPQELGLCDNLTINQTLKYFKLIYRISNEEYYIRRRELTTLTNLPDGHRLVRDLSGGTKRRLSIAVALINNPSLVILDEPTVGIDALLRHQIWNYLVQKTNEGMTMIIVTHYIEEAVHAGRVGLLRNGSLLAEDNPQTLMAIHKEPNLEAVFLKLCYFEDQGFIKTKTEDSNHHQHHDSHSHHSHQACYCSPFPVNHHSPTDLNNNNEDIFIISKYHAKITPSSSSDCSLSNCSSCSPPSSTATISSTMSLWRRMFNTKLLMIKLWILFTLIYRNLKKFLYSYFSIVIILLPATQALIFCFAVSRNITLLPAAVYDAEIEPGYGKLFIETLQPIRGHWIKPRFYGSIDDIEKAVEKNEAIGAIWIPENYTQAVDARIEDGFSADNQTVEDSTIRIFLDNSLYTLSMEFYTSLLESYMDFSRKLFQDKYMDMLEVPIKMETTDLSKNYRFNDYYMPGYFLIFTYISQITIASLTLNKECKDGLFERSLIAGVSHELVFFSHIITNFLLSTIQLLMLDLIAFTLFNNPNNSSYWLKSSLFLMESLNATSLGFIISSLVDSEAGCLILVWFVTFPQFLSSGIFWPLESLSKPLYYLFYLWPLSIPIKTIRHIMLQGWDLTNIHVQYGFLSVGLSMILFFCLALTIFKHR